MRIDTAAQIESFKNWFFGRPNFQLMDDVDEQPFFDIPVHIATESELPKEGDPDAKYFVAETGDTYRYVDGGYQVIDVYSYGDAHRYREAPRRVIAREVITDPSYGIPSISADQIRAGAPATLATLYNIQALLVDLEQIRRMHVHGYKTTLMDVLSQGAYTIKEQNVTNWFSKHHTLLYRLLVSCMRTKDAFNKEVIDALYKHNYVLTWDDAKNRPVFKVDEFVVFL